VALRLGANQVLRDVSLEVKPGEVVGLLGRNGAGKTTLLRAISRTLEPDSGEVRLDGRPLGSLTRRELARAIAVVPQESNIPFPFTAGELVLMGRAPHQSLLGLESSADLSLARGAMTRMGIAALADRPVFELSGGERQLVIFARALAQDAEILLLDEPTAFLDLRHRIEVLRVVRELAAAGRASLVVSHDLGLAARACDRLVLLSDGVVAAAGAAAEVLTREHLDEAFGISAQVLIAPDGEPVVVPRISGDD
jgi:iron complex transport system ATP-binding protein